MNKKTISKEEILDKTVFNSYFLPKPFEKNGEIYKLLGVKKFQAIVMGTFGKLMRVCKMDTCPGLYFIGKEINELDIKVYEACTRFNESFHALQTPINLIVVVHYGALGDYQAAAARCGLTIVNSYCVMLQRYNRSRVYNVLAHRKGKNRID